MPFIPTFSTGVSKATPFDHGLALKVAAGAAIALGSPDPKVPVMLAILVVSLVAVSFPAISNSTKALKVPNALFFVGKHFGTGVILATAFIHLLPDSFTALLHKSVEEKYGKIGKWTGLIMYVLSP